MKDTGIARYALMAIGAMAVIILALALFHVSLPDLLFNLTGEEDLVEGIKGAAALLLLRMTQPPLDLQPYTPMPYTGFNPYGVNTFLEQEAELANVRRSLEMIQEAGFGWIRQEFPWEDIEIHGKGDFEDRRTEPYRSAWLKYDHIVDLAEAHGLEIVARLDNPPAWSRAAGDAQGTQAPPDDLADYGDFVQAVVSRYRGRIRYIQLWNEPNIYPEWGDRPVDPEAYTELLKVGYVRAKEVDPDVVVLSAGLAPTVETGPRNLSDLIFLERMYAAGAKDYFDVLAVMGYGLWTGPTDRRVSADRTNFARPQLIRDTMVRHGDAAKPVWIMEMGWNAVPPDLPAPFGRVTPEQQARYAVLAYQRVQDEWPWAGVAFTWYFRRPDWEWHSRPEGYFRLVEPDFTPLPVYHALRKLALSPPVVSVGYHQEDHWALSWTGNWQDIHDDGAVLSSYRAADQPGARLTFTFRGTDLDLVVVKSPDGGTIETAVDGRPTALTDLRSDHTEFGLQAPLVRNLPDDEHRVEIVVSDPGQVGIDGLIVRRSQSVWWRLVLGGLAVVVIISAWAMLSGDYSASRGIQVRCTSLGRMPCVRSEVDVQRTVANG